MTDQLEIIKDELEDLKCPQPGCGLIFRQVPKSLKITKENFKLFECPGHDESLINSGWRCWICGQCRRTHKWIRPQDINSQYCEKCNPRTKHFAIKWGVGFGPAMPAPRTDFTLNEYDILCQQKSEGQK